MNIQILQYNNYYNRIVKREENADDYPEPIYTLENTNFNPNDGVDSEVLIGDTKMYDGTGDYLLVIDPPKTIISRWFILEAQRTRAGQWKLTIRRDTLAEYKDIVLDSPCFVQKGYVSGDDPLIFNNEDMRFNQIKQKEYLLDGGELKTPWIVAYLSRYHTNEDGTSTTEFNKWEGTFRDQPGIEDYTLSSLSDYKYFKYVNNQGGGGSEYKYLNAESGLYFRIPYRRRPNGVNSVVIYGYLQSTGWNASRDSTTNFSNIYAYCADGTEDKNGTPPTMDNSVQVWQNAVNELNRYNTIEDTTLLPINSYSNIGTPDGFYTLQQESGKIIKVGSGSSAKYYKVVVYAGEAEYEFNHTVYINRDNSGAYGQYCWNNVMLKLNNLIFPSDMIASIQLAWPFTNPTVYLSLQEISDATTLTYSVTYDHICTKNSAYEILAAPYYNVTLQHGSTILNHQGEVALNWFMDMAKNGTVYDLQLVPFVGIDDNDLSTFEIASCSYTGGLTQAWGVKLKESSFSRYYPLSIPVNTDVKIGNECDFYRITSPNGVGQFDFNPAKNGGLQGYEVDCTLLPFNPYIKVNPRFNTYSTNSQTNLYGGDFNDYRGLICGGDFSLPVVTNAWETYQINNKYYQQIFDRQSQSLEYQNNWQLAENITGAVTGTAGGVAAGAASGAVLGSIVPGIGTAVGAFAGAIIGGISSAIGGTVDVIANQSKFNEQMANRKDQFNYSLGTIRARPDTLTRTTAYNINNKYFPYIEYYTCTEKEKQAFLNKLKYDGMTVMVIGTLRDYLNPNEDESYVKGSIIRLEGLEEDYHIVQVIVGEVARGVYIKQ